MTTGENTVGDVFSAGAAEFHSWSKVLWDPVGEATADVAALTGGESVLDACCGAGASALPAARAVGAVGPTGRVDAVDLADGLLAIGERRAREEGLANLRFHRHEVTSWPVPGPGYNVVQCGLGVFFFPDVHRDSAALTRMLRPGGRFVVTVWEKGALGGWQAGAAGRGPDGARPAPPAADGATGPDRYRRHPRGLAEGPGRERTPGRPAAVRRPTVRRRAGSWPPAAGHAPDAGRAVTGRRPAGARRVHRPAHRGRGHRPRRTRPDGHGPLRRLTGRPDGAAGRTP
ncbi:class I SAM-dependent methyltransferase [Streptomyces coeruleorubidus]|nr:class I SAM-dependent methyltransferase [Streptomyces coeruleorubidus]WDV55424.1 class I SAM-dependent methyltransferase [Streptomyces coeruleorubidus]